MPGYVFVLNTSKSFLNIKWLTLFFAFFFSFSQAEIIMNVTDQQGARKSETALIKSHS